MTSWHPGPALDRLTEALEAEILAAPVPEVNRVVRHPDAEPHLKALRILVVRAVETAEKQGPLLPEERGAPSSLRRP